MATRRRAPLRSGVLAAAASVALLLGALLLGALGTSARAQDDAGELTITLAEYEDSGVSGWATLEPTEDALEVTMAVEGRAVTGNHPSHIHTGTCADFDPNPTFPLTTVILDPLSDDGESATAVEDVTLDGLLDDDYVVLVHKSAEELTDYFVCGDIKESNAYTAPRTAGSMAPPNAGTGSVGGDGGGPTAASLLAGAGALALTVAAAGVALRRRLRPHE